jgi:phosphohistidine phosphatase SixA
MVLFDWTSILRKTMTDSLRRRAAAIVVVALCGVTTAWAQTQVVVIVRHAEKADAPKGDVALTDRGRARADALAATLVDAAVDTIVTTERRRSRETAAPLVAARHLTPVVVPSSDDNKAHARAVAQAVRNGGAVVLVVGHTDTVPEIIEALGGPKIAEICDDQYGMMFTMRTDAGKPSRLIRSTYGAPDPAGADCHAMKADH